MKSYVPYVVETSIGSDRMFLAVLSHSFREEELENGESRVVLKIPPILAPLKAHLVHQKKMECQIKARKYEVSSNRL